MRIAIMGTGGMGGFLGAKLAEAGHNVAFIARGAHLRAIKTKGLRVLSDAGNIHIQPAKAYDNPEEVGPVDIILFCVKLYDTEVAAQACVDMMDNNTLILSLQNGVESVDIISKFVGEGRAIGGSIYVSAKIDSPGVIKHLGGSNIIRFAEVDNQASNRTELIQHIFAKTNVDAILEDNLQHMLWTKFILLSANAGIGSLMNCGAREVCEDPIGKELLVGAMEEAYNVAQAMGIGLPENTVEMVLNLIISMSEQSEMLPSQCIDMRNGNRLELEWIQGTIQRFGHKYNVPTPINNTAYVTLRRFAGGRKKA